MKSRGNVEDVQGTKGSVCRVVLAQSRGRGKKLMLCNSTLVENTFQPRPADAFKGLPTFHRPDFTSNHQSTDRVFGFENAQSRHREDRPLFRTPP